MLTKGFGKKKVRQRISTGSWVGNEPLTRKLHGKKEVGKYVGQLSVTIKNIEDK
jgi:hypothetical protein